MSFPEQALERRSLLLAVVFSLFIHGLALYVPRQPAPVADGQRPPIEARLQQRKAPAPVPPLEVPAPPKKALTKAAPRPRLMAVHKPTSATSRRAPKWTIAEKAEMDGFLNELGATAKAKQPPTLAQRSLAMAQAEARQQAQQESKQLATLERRPNSPDPDPFSLEMYLEGLLKHLNRSSAYVKNDPRSRGVRKAVVQFRVNPDGTLKSFEVLNAADQGAEITFIKAIVERAAPFSPFPPDVNRAARSMAVRICIQPSSAGSFGFSRAGDGQGC